MYYKAALEIQGMQEGASGGGRSLSYLNYAAELFLYLFSCDL